jgi:hypothetical protein
MTTVATEPARARRPRHRRRTRSVRTWVMFAVIVGIAAVLPALVALAARTIANSKEGRSITISDIAVPRAELPMTPGALVVSVDDSGEAVGFAVLAIAPSGSGGTIVLLPAGTQGTLPGQTTPGRLADAYRTGGLTDAVTAVEGFLGVTFDQAVDARPADLEQLLAPFAPIPVDLDTAVLAPDATGSPTVVQPAGHHDLTAAEAAAVLTAHMPNESEVVRLPHVAAVWHGVASRAGVGVAATTASSGIPTSTAEVVTSTAGSTAATTTTSSAPAPVLGDVTAFVAALRAGPATSRQVDATPVLDRVNNPLGADLLFVDPPGVRLLMAQVLPSAVSPSNGNMRVRLVNGTGDPAMAYEAVARLIYLGANVVLVSDYDGQLPSRTQIELQDMADADAAGRFGPYLGGADAVASTVKIDGIDATIVLGRDFVTYVDEERAKATTTTSSTTTPTTTVAPTTTAKKKSSTTKKKPAATVPAKKKKGSG